MLTRCTLGLLMVALALPALAADGPRVLLLSKSSGFEHSAIKRSDGPSHVEGVLGELAAQHGFVLEVTKDAGRISAASLAELDAVVFYTTGDLTVAGGGDTLFGGDGSPAMGARGVADLQAWVEAGGALLGYHSATDTFKNEDGSPSPYVRLLGGEFLVHGRQFEGRLQVVDPSHATMKAIPQSWTMMDEWYAFKNLDTDSMHVLALLDTESDTHGQKMYAGPSYPVIWCKTVGEGRVFYNAMGHREDVWDNTIFQGAFIDALGWATGESTSDATPNWQSVVPTE